MIHREQFETWYCTVYWNFKPNHPDLWDGSHYRHPSVELAWQAWQAAMHARSKSRTEFETWCAGQSWPNKQSWSIRWDFDRYSDLSAELAWQSWMASVCRRDETDLVPACPA
jgi:hypothetical protein